MYELLVDEIDTEQKARRAKEEALEKRLESEYNGIVRDNLIRWQDACEFIFNFFSKRSNQELATFRGINQQVINHATAVIQAHLNQLNTLLEKAAKVGKSTVPRLKILDSLEEEMSGALTVVKKIKQTIGQQNELDQLLVGENSIGELRILFNAKLTAATLAHAALPSERKIADVCSIIESAKEKTLGLYLMTREPSTTTLPPGNNSAWVLFQGNGKNAAPTALYFVERADQPTVNKITEFKGSLTDFVKTFYPGDNPSYSDIPMLSLPQLDEARLKTKRTSGQITSLKFSSADIERIEYYLKTVKENANLETMKKCAAAGERLKEVIENYRENQPTEPVTLSELKKMAESVDGKEAYLRLDFINREASTLMDEKRGHYLRELKKRLPAVITALGQTEEERLAKGKENKKEVANKLIAERILTLCESIEKSFKHQMRTVLSMAIVFNTEVNSQEFAKIYTQYKEVKELMQSYFEKLHKEIYKEAMNLGKLAKSLPVVAPANRPKPFIRSQSMITTSSDQNKARPLVRESVTPPIFPKSINTNIPSPRPVITPRNKSHHLFNIKPIEQLSSSQATAVSFSYDHPSATQTTDEDQENLTPNEPLHSSAEKMKIPIIGLVIPAKIQAMIRGERSKGQIRAINDIFVNIGLMPLSNDQLDKIQAQLNGFGINITVQEIKKVYLSNKNDLFTALASLEVITINPFIRAYEAEIKQILRTSSSVEMMGYLNALDTNQARNNFIEQFYPLLRIKIPDYQAWSTLMVREVQDVISSLQDQKATDLSNPEFKACCKFISFLYGKFIKGTPNEALNANQFLREISAIPDLSFSLKRDLMGLILDELTENGTNKPLTRAIIAASRSSNYGVIVEHYVGPSDSSSTDAKVLTRMAQFKATTKLSGIFEPYDVKQTSSSSSEIKLKSKSEDSSDSEENSPSSTNETSSLLVGASDHSSSAAAYKVNTNVYNGSYQENNLSHTPKLGPRRSSSFV